MLQQKLKVYNGIDKRYNVYTIVQCGGEVMNQYEHMNKLLQEDNGYLFTAQVEKAGISRTYLAKHDYDIVIGTMADDQIYSYVSDYIDGTITREQFWVLAKFKYPTHQIVFCTDAARKCLTYRGFEEVR